MSIEEAILRLVPAAMLDVTIEGQLSIKFVFSSDYLLILQPGNNAEENMIVMSSMSLLTHLSSGLFDYDEI